jgi:hypothetical protein
MAERKRPTKTAPTPPEADVRELQDHAGATERDFLRDLDRATTNRSSERLGDSARPGRASPRT